MQRLQDVRFQLAFDVKGAEARHGHQDVSQALANIVGALDVFQAEVANIDRSLYTEKGVADQIAKARKPLELALEREENRAARLEQRAESRLPEPTLSESARREVRDIYRAEYGKDSLRIMQAVGNNTEHALALLEAPVAMLTTEHAAQLKRQLTGASPFAAAVQEIRSSVSMVRKAL